MNINCPNCPNCPTVLTVLTVLFVTTGMSEAFSLQHPLPGLSYLVCHHAQLVGCCQAEVPEGERFAINEEWYGFGSPVISRGLSRQLILYVFRNTGCRISL